MDAEGHKTLRHCEYRANSSAKVEHEDRNKMQPLCMICHDDVRQ